LFFRNQEEENHNGNLKLKEISKQKDQFLLL